MTFLSKSDGITLIDHLLETGDKCYELIKKLTDDKRIQSICVIAALFHDIGKVRPEWQEHLLNGTPSDIDHSVASAYLFDKYINLNMSKNDYEYKYIIKTILFHHPITKQDAFEYTDDIKDNSELLCIIKKLIEHYNDIIPDAPIKIYLNTEYYEEINFSKYEQYLEEDSAVNGNFIPVFNTVRMADILSSDKSLDFETLCNRSVKGINPTKPENYDERYDIQQEYADKLYEHQISMFISPTGFGKTILALLYSLKNDRKTYFICPTNATATNSYRTMAKELSELKISDKVTISLLLSGEYIYGDNNADITITNIDNFMRPQLKSDPKSKKANANIRTYSMLFFNVIFDEFDDYLSESALLAAYHSLMKARKLCKSKTLLMSATSIKQLYEPYTDGANFEYKSEKILNKMVRIHYGKPSFKINNKNYLYVVNSVQTCQDINISGMSDDIIHARYTDQDRELKFDKLYDEHGKDVSHTTTWTANGIISRGVNISFGNLIISYPTPEKLIQTLGRCNRWNECETIPELYIYCDATNRSEIYGVNTISSKVIADEFFLHLKRTFADNSVVTFEELYECRKKFYELPNIKDDIFKKYYKHCMLRSYNYLSRINYQYSNPSLCSNSNITRLSNKPGLRSSEGTSAFFATFMDNNNQPTDPIKVDNMIINIDKISEDDEIARSIEYLWKNGYFKSKAQKEKALANKRSFFETALKKATSKDSPYPISKKYYHYDSVNGLMKK